ncbi:expressed unknown protein [Seminavis robusta]|uniref:Uncharacterized protein n=1 Tax=Seminavis robusta TaxID=568900 RepID=A0A9N8EE79_9STRA|nr:expressed unknown protein [Seminavis robusta]|eukprot:Sro810_g205810.1 n/a (139) ;mRNA; f:36087-36503
MNRFLSTLLSLFALLGSTMAFVPPSRTAMPATTTALPTTSAIHFPPALQRQRKSMAPVQTMSLFGLGAPELAIILIAAAFLLGPSKLAELGKDAGKIAGELKEVPKEFQKGLSEGEAEAAAMRSAAAPAEILEKKEDK